MQHHARQQAKRRLAAVNGSDDQPRCRFASPWMERQKLDGAKPSGKRGGKLGQSVGPVDRGEPQYSRVVIR